MFTGIIEETGSISAIAETATGVRLSVATQTVHEGTKVGDSISVNGCCLTAVKIRRKGTKGELAFDLLSETWNRTSFSFLKESSLVNLERALLPTTRLGGHFVSGHVDATGTILRWEKSGADYVLEIKAPRDVLRYIVFKGSIAVDGISLTVAEVKRDRFSLWIIPHTRAVTNLSQRKQGDLVNLETDVIGKYVERFTARIS